MPTPFNTGKVETYRDCEQATRVYSPEHQLFAEGDMPQGLFFLSTGRVKLYSTAAQGKIFITKIARPGELLGLNAAVLGHAHGEDVPFIMTAAARKVASYVLESAYHDGRESGEGVSVDLPVTLHELSALLFVRSERIEDVFERFEDRRWLYRGQRTITVLDEPALQAISRGSETS